MMLFSVLLFELVKSVVFLLLQFDSGECSYRVIEYVDLKKELVTQSRYLPAPSLLKKPPPLPLKKGLYLGAARTGDATVTESAGKSGWWVMAVHRRGT